MSRKLKTEANSDAIAAFTQHPLPDGWIQSRLSDLTIRSEYGTSTKCDYGGATTPVLRIPNIARGEIDISDLKRAVTDIELGVGDELQPGDMLICRTNGSLSLLGKAAVIRSAFDLPFSFASYLLRFRFAERDVLPRWIHFFVSSVGRDFIERNAASSAGQHNISLSKLHSMPLPVAPLNEQRRIVSKLEELFSDLDAGVAALKRAKANLKRYRAAVLKAAVEGKLTEEWRAKHPNTEPASRLLARILNERRKRWEADQLAKFTAARKLPPKNWKEKYVAELPPDTKDLPELPTGWCWTSVEQLGNVQLGRQRSPKNRSDKFPTRYIRAANITEAGIALDDVLDMEFQPRELETYRLEPGDILLSEASGSPDQVGKPVVWNGEIEDCCFQNTVIRLRPEGMPSEYPLTVFRYYYMSKLFAKVAAGVGINHLSAAKFSALPFPLAPLAEQQEITGEVEQRLSTIAVSVSQIEANLIRASRLRQSILKLAFEGKLVPQNPKDEPTTVLMERLRASRSSHEGIGEAQSATKARGRDAKPKILEVKVKT